MNIRFDGYYRSQPILTTDGNTSTGEYQVTSYVFLKFDPPGQYQMAVRSISEHGFKATGEDISIPPDNWNWKGTFQKEEGRIRMDHFAEWNQSMVTLYYPVREPDTIIEHNGHELYFIENTG